MAQLNDTMVQGDLRVTGTMFGTQAGNYATCATAAGTAAKEVTISGFTLTTGIHVYVKFTVTNTAAVASLTLNVSGTGVKAMKYRGGNLPAVGTLSASRVYEFIYDGTNWELVGDLDTNTQSVSGVKGNAESSYRTGQVNLTAANIGASASDHTHGNITNDGKIGSTANLPVVTGTSGAVTTGSWATSASDTGSSSSAGSANTFSRGDHTHKVAVATGDSAGQVKVAGQNASVNGWANKANLASPAFTGTPTAPTAASGTNTTQIATTQFVQTAIGATRTFTASSSSKNVLAFTLSSSSADISNQGVIMAFAIRDSNNCNASGLLYIRKAADGNCCSFAVVDGFTNRNNSTNILSVLQDTSADNNISVYLNIGIYSQVSLSIVNRGRCGITWGTDTSATLPEAYGTVPIYETVKKPARISGTTTINNAVGSTSVPTYVDADGQVKACTDDFARDSEVVSSVQVETASNTTKMTYTKNGSKTDILAFMTTAEAHSLWTNAKANAS